MAFKIGHDTSHTSSWSGRLRVRASSVTAPTPSCDWTAEFQAKLAEMHGPFALNFLFPSLSRRSVLAGPLEWKWPGAQPRWSVVSDIQRERLQQGR